MTRMTSYQDDEVVMVPVPKSLLMVVYAALAKATGDVASAQAEEAVEVSGQGEFTEAMVSRLESELHITAIKVLITRLAEQAPSSLTFKDAVQVAGVESNVLRAQLGSLSKTSKRLFKTTIWPMSVRYAEGGEAIYWMEPKIAEWWLEAAGRES